MRYVAGGSEPEASQKRQRPEAFLMLLGLLAASIAMTPAAFAGDSVPSLPSPAKPGRYSLTLQSQGFDRIAQIQIPPGYTADSKPPLVLMLHGAGGSGTGALDKDGWSAKADQEGFIAVAPDGLPARPKLAGNFFTNPPLWNSGQLKASNPRAAIDDVAYIGQLLDVLQQRVPYDQARVFCTGHSNGGAMAFRLGAELADRFAAIGTVAGLIAVENPQPTRPLPTLYILGTKDPLMPIAGGEVKLPWGSRQNPPVAELLSKWAVAIGCQQQPQTIRDADNVKQVIYPSKTGGPQLTVLYLAGHGHHWPGGQRVLPENMTGPITSKLDATAVLWEFFKSGKVAIGTLPPQ